jgi:hypothetical protein
VRTDAPARTKGFRLAASPPSWGTQPAWRPFGLAAAELLKKQPGVVVVPHKRMLG